MKNGNKRLRTKNFTKKEEIQLVNLIIKHKNIIENKTTNNCSPKQKELAWRKIEIEFNRLNKNKYDNYRTCHVLKRKYQALKRRVKKKCAVITAAMRANETPDHSMKLTANEKRVKKLILFSLEGIPGVKDSDGCN